MPDDRIKAVLERAAADPDFYDALVENREATLDACDLSVAEKALLMAPKRVQLRKMVDEVRRKPFLRPGRIAAYAGIGAAAALGFSFFAAVTATAGVSREVGYELGARHALHGIAAAERIYRQDHGRYAGIEDLTRTELIVIRDGTPYEFRITVHGDTFTATARHRTRPKTRRAFQVGPDGVVKPLE